MIVGFNMQLIRPYIIRYPTSLDEGYDGVHDGGIKGLKPDAPKEVVEEFKRYISYVEKMKSEGYR